MQNNEISQSSEERKSLKIKKLISLMAKKRCLYILIETEESNNFNFKIYNEETNNQLPVFFTSTMNDPNFLREGEIYKITNEKFLDSVINTEKYSQIILLDKGYLYEKEKEKSKSKSNFPLIYLILNRNEKNDIYIYTQKTNKIEKENFIEFICEDQNCKAEGILDLLKNDFSIIKEHEIQHKDYHINDDVHFSTQFFWSFIFKYREIKTLQIVLLPHEYDIKMIYNDPLLFNRNTNNTYINLSKNIFNTVKEKEKEKVNNIINKEEKIFELSKDLNKENKDNKNKELLNNNNNTNEKSNIFLGKSRSKSPPVLFNSINYNNNTIVNNDTNKTNNDNKINNIKKSNYFSTSIDEIDSYKCPPLEIVQSDNNINISYNTNDIFKLEKEKKDNPIINLNEDKDKNHIKSIIPTIIEEVNKESAPNPKELKEIEVLNSINIKKEEDNTKIIEEEIYEGDNFSLSGSEEVFRDCFINSTKRRKIIKNINFMIFKNKIYENDELKELQLDEDTFSYCSQCSLCAQSKQNNNNNYIETSINNDMNSFNQSLNNSNNNNNSNDISYQQDPIIFNNILTYSTPENDFSQKKKENNTPTTGSKYKKKEFHFFPSKKNHRLFYAKIYIDSHKECKSNDPRKEQWLKYFEIKYGKNHKLGMHFHRDDKTGKIYGYQNRHLEVGYYDKRLVYYCLNRCPGNGRFDCEKEIFFVEKSHSCTNTLSTQQAEVVKFFEENPRVSDIQIIRVFAQND